MLSTLASFVLFFAGPGRCDFRSYKPVHMTDWLPGGIVKRVVPIYPAEAKARGVLGRVDVKTLINSDGDLIQACGRGPKLLIPAAENAALKWKFRTPTLTTDKGLIKFPYIEEILSFEFVVEQSKQESQVVSPGRGRGR